MLKNVFFLLMTTSWLFSLQSLAQSRNEIAVGKAVENLRKAMVEADSITLSKLVMDELSYGHSGGKVEGKASFISSLTSGQSDFVTMELTNQTISVLKKTAIVRHTLSATTNDRGKPSSVKLGILTVWVKNGHQWKLLARQAIRQ